MAATIASMSIATEAIVTPAADELAKLVLLLPTLVSVPSPVFGAEALVLSVVPVPDSPGVTGLSSGVGTIGSLGSCKTISMGIVFSIVVVFLSGLSPIKLILFKVLDAIKMAPQGVQTSLYHSFAIIRMKPYGAIISYNDQCAMYFIHRYDIYEVCITILA